MSGLPCVQFKHMGINCTDIDLMTEFYCRVLGFVVSDEGVASFGSRIAFLTQDVEEHHQLVLIAGRPSEVPFNTINQFSCKLGDLATLKRYLTVLSDHGVADVAQVDHGNAWSMYFSDPEGNTIELYVDTPFYSPQPCREPLDLTHSESEILARTESMCRQRPGFMTREQWQISLRERIASTRR